MAHARASIGITNYAVAITAGHHELKSDEGPSLGGMDVGPAPYELLCSALCACTAITLRMYAERKQWPLRGVQVDSHFEKAEKQETIVRVLKFDGQPGRSAISAIGRHCRANACDADTEAGRGNQDFAGVTTISRWSS